MGAEIKSGIVPIEIRELECERGVSHQAIETIFRDEAVCRKAVAELAWILAYRRGMLISQHRSECLDLCRLSCPCHYRDGSPPLFLFHRADFPVRQGRYVALWLHLVRFMLQLLLCSADFRSTCARAAGHRLGDCVLEHRLIH